MAAQLPRFSGFADPIFDAQATFRSVMSAVANPGRIEVLSVVADMPLRLATSLAAAALALFDHDTFVFLDRSFASDPNIAASLSFHTGCRFVEDPSRATFALIGDPGGCPKFSGFAQGTLEYPDRSTTLLFQVERLDNEAALTLRGPGIPGVRHLAAVPLPASISEELGANRERFPQGVDLLLCCGSRLAALPRSTRVEG
ncbi:MAG: phosphonate C-P lyase system protein PhnH [Hyphomicrobiales bacterium]|nr:phosphonate C-P lyase system protein PhnH [Hyphomicrobiales bacterium]